MSAAYAAFLTPPASCRPTPLYWWSGADIDRSRLAVQLAELAGKGVGGTIVGYSHLPDGDLDHGLPVPLSEDWWSLFGWYTQERARLGMTVGIQDYGINGPILRAAGKHTRDLRPGQLRHVVERRQGPGVFIAVTGNDSLVTAVARSATGTSLPLAMTFDGTTLSYRLPAGVWDVSLVLKQVGMIGPYRSSFDPMHPNAGALLIDALYEPFSDHLGSHFGSTFTTFFQDELDFGLRMPMWNDLVAERIADVYGFDADEWLPALWLDLGPHTARFRVAYRDVVVGLLEDHYFKPIFEWHELHGTSMCMDQVSRGDLRMGRRAYGDYMQTMRWYNGPGNDDPDLTTPRAVAAFKVSASLARLNDREMVANEAFHSSGWGIAPEAILAGLNAGFAFGVNHVIMHGLDYTTEGGWWEWASPDFHFRQPWWKHSETLWTYVTRTSALLRYGRGVVDVAVLDPTQDLDLVGDAATSPEYAIEVLDVLARGGQDCDLLDRPHLTAAHITDRELRIGNCAYRALLIPDMRSLRDDSLEAVRRFGDAGGLVIVLGDPPAQTESGPCAAESWASARRLPITALAELPRLLKRLWEPDFDAHDSGLVAAHRRSGTTDVYFIANVTDDPVSTYVDVRATGRIETFDAWTGRIHPRGSARNTEAGNSTRLLVELAPGLATFVVVDRQLSRETFAATRSASHTIDLGGPWRIEAVPVLDNSFGDFEFGGAPMGVETWRIDTGPSATGPWTSAWVRDGMKFLALGPIASVDGAAVEAALLESAPVLGPTGLTSDGRELSWRPYGFSYRTGVTDDPLLLDRMTGPHGLKGVPDEFLDPSVLDPEAPAGSVYYFWSTIQVSDPEVTVSAGSRSAFKVWVGGRPTLEQADEVAPARTPAWGLRDLGVVAKGTRISLPTGRSDVLLRLAVAAGQPTRASLAIGADVPGAHPRARLRWWHGEQACLTFDPAPTDRPSTIWVRITTPPGLVAAELSVHGRLRAAALASTGRPLRISNRTAGHGSNSVLLEAEGPVEFVDELLLDIETDTHGYRGAAVLDEPVRWTLGQGTATSGWFVDNGLADFSGEVSYRRTFEWQLTGAAVFLTLPGLQESARVSVNGEVVGVLLTTQQDLEVSSALRDGTNSIEVEVANTLTNRFAVLPSPFSHMQEPGGGFGGVRLRALAAAD